jgi:dihydroorotase
MFNLPVIDLPRDLSLSRRGNAHNGPQSLKMGLGGYPRIAEELFVQRAISVSKIANTRIHLTSISSSSSVEMIRDAKMKGSLITADVTPHHLSLCEKSIKEFNPNFKTSPPLREESDRLKLVQGLLDGTIDCIATAHEPYPEHEKNVEFDLAPTGVIGLETALSVCYQTLNLQNGFSWLKLISAMSLNPSNILNIDQGRLNIGSDADIVIFDPDKNWIYSTNERSSNATNSSFEYKKFKGKIVTTFFKGSEVYCT